MSTQTTHSEDGPSAGPAESGWPSVFIIGDSTASTWTTAHAPETGWGQALPLFLDRRHRVVNAALSGASSKSFADAGRFDPVLSAIRPGDVLLVSFGHNDEKVDIPTHYTEPWTTYQEYLTGYLDGARGKGAQVVLVTSVERRRFDSAGGGPYTTHGDYSKSMRALADRRDVPLVDLAELSLRRWKQLGKEGSTEYFLWLKPGESNNYPEGVEDDTHFSGFGAIEVARIVAEELENMEIRDLRIARDSVVSEKDLVWPEPGEGSV
jgi:lysophospholipase L1-like esterase